MGLFGSDDDVVLENADLDCEPQNEFANRKEVAKIDEYLDPGEKVHFLARSEGERFEIDGEKVDDTLAHRTAATDKRIVIKKKKNPLGYESQTIRYENITSVSYDSGMMKKKLTIATSSNKYRIGIGKLADDAARNMESFIRQKMNEVQRSGSVESEKDPLDKLEQLQDLKEQGVISEEEFELKKESILDDI